jgi:hypothetical protein
MSLHGRASREQRGSRWVPPFGNKKVISWHRPVIRAADGIASARAASMAWGPGGGRLLLRFECLSGPDGPPSASPVHMVSSRHDQRGVLQRTPILHISSCHRVKCIRCIKPYPRAKLLAPSIRRRDRGIACRMIGLFAYRWRVVLRKPWTIPRDPAQQSPGTAANYCTGSHATIGGRIAS